MSVPIIKTSIHVNNALRVLGTWLKDPDVVEICANQPGEVFVERLGSHFMEAHKVEDLTADKIQNIAERIAADSNQNVNAQNPLLSAGLDSGERVQVVLSPATTSVGAFAIRKQVLQKMTLGDYKKRGAFSKYKVFNLETVVSELDSELCSLLHKNNLEKFLREAVKNRYSILLSGGTSSGKTTFLNALIEEVPEGERILSIEDTREVKPHQRNYLPLIASKGGQGISNVTIETLLQAAMRLRPDRIFLGEVRGAEAYSFLRAVNTGHPGSITTIHADSPDGAIEQLAMLVMQSGLSLQKSDIIDYIKLVIPIVIQLSRVDGWRGITSVYFNKMTPWLQLNGKRK